MDNKIIKLLFGFGVLISCNHSAADTLKIAAIDWCPQICPNEQRPGYVVDILNTAFKNSDWNYQINYYPWSRAIKGVKEGSFHILLSPAKHEAPDLIYPTYPIGYQQMCFFTKQQDDWKFTDEYSLQGKRIGIAQDTSVAALNQLVNQQSEAFQFQPYHGRFIKQNTGKVLKGRLDSFIFTRNATLFELKKLGLDTQFRIAGCVAEEPIYAAFTPSSDERQFSVMEVIQFIDQRMATMTANGTIAKIKASYGIQ